MLRLPDSLGTAIVGKNGAVHKSNVLSMTCYSSPDKHYPTEATLLISTYTQTDWYGRERPAGKNVVRTEAITGSGTPSL